jgi:alkanesulfonate monooxygenase SsuD/methylene tetrahydromethanopterin reductase-like flavin-dependent oxidoreductase (luciferase family)
MRFGLPGGRGSLLPGSTVSTLELARTAEDLGFDCLWIGEEHFSEGVSQHPRSRPSALVLASALATATSRIRIGFTVLLLPLHNPLRLSEDLATLDVLSGGRVNFGVGWPAEHYVHAFGQGLAAISTADSLAEILGYWKRQPKLIDGVEYYVEPSPLQLPHPPIYVAAYDNETIDWAGAQSHALIMSAFQSRISLRKCLDRFASGGGNRAGSPIERFCFVADSNALARQQAWPLVVGLTERLRQNGQQQQSNRIFAEAELDPERFYNETAIVGDPHTVAERVASIRDEYGVNAINLRPSFWGTCPPGLQRTTVELFAAEVMPRFV